MGTSHPVKLLFFLTWKLLESDIAVFHKRWIFYEVSGIIPSLDPTERYQIEALKTLGR